MDSKTLVILDLIAVSGGVVAFAAWQLISVRRDQRKRENKNDLARSTSCRRGSSLLRHTLAQSARARVKDHVARVNHVGEHRGDPCLRNDDSLFQNDLRERTRLRRAEDPDGCLHRDPVGERSESAVA